MPDERCENCRFWFMAQCRRFPPTPQTPPEPSEADNETASALANKWLEAGLLGSVRAQALMNIGTVYDHIATALAAERQRENEACALWHDEQAAKRRTGMMPEACTQFHLDSAAAIRARQGEQSDE